MSAAAHAHTGEHVADQRREAEEIGFEHVAKFLVFAFLNGGQITIPCVVDQHVDAAKGLLSGGNGKPDLGVAGDVELQSNRGLWIPRDDVLDLGGIARRNHGTVAVLQHGPGQRPAQAGRTAGDEPDGGRLEICGHGISFMP